MSKFVTILKSVLWLKHLVSIVTRVHTYRMIGAHICYWGIYVYLIP